MDRDTTPPRRGRSFLGDPDSLYYQALRRWTVDALARAAAPRRFPRWGGYLLALSGMSRHGLPFGISLYDKLYSEPQLIALTYAFEQTTQTRQTPPTPPVTALRDCQGG